MCCLFEDDFVFVNLGLQYLMAAFTVGSWRLRRAHLAFVLLLFPASRSVSGVPSHLQMMYLPASCYLLLYSLFMLWAFRAVLKLVGLMYFTLLGGLKV